MAYTHLGRTITQPPTTSRELWGWYSYGMAAEVFAVCGVGSFLPVTLEQLARENGVLASDGVTPCIVPKTETLAHAGSSGSLMRRDGDACVLMLVGHKINTSSFAMYSFSLAIFFQALLLVSIGAISDYGGTRKQLLLAFAFIGAASCILYILVSPAIYLLAVPLTIVGVACLGASFVLLNAFLPLLAANHPSAQTTSVPMRTTADVDEDILETEDFQHTSFSATSSSTRLTLSNQISSKGIGLGYAGAVLVQILSIGIIILYKSTPSPTPSSSTLPMRTVLLLVGTWWAIFTLPTLFWLHPRPGPPLPLSPSSSSSVLTSRLPWLRYIFFAWSSLYSTLKLALRLRQITLFLIGWFILSDGIATISGTAILFARTELSLPTEGVALLSITATASGIVGAVAWPWLARRYGWSTMGVVLRCVCLLEIIPLYGLLGFIPFIRSIGFGGLQRQWEIFPLAFLMGFVMGGISSYCRSLYGTLIPPGMEAAFYALYAVTDKGSSVIGPAVVGRIVDATGSVRDGFWFLAVLMVLPLPVLRMVDLVRGREDALRMAEERGKGEMAERDD